LIPLQPSNRSHKARFVICFWTIGGGYDVTYIHDSSRSLRIVLENYKTCCKALN